MGVRFLHLEQVINASAMVSASLVCALRSSYMEEVEYIKILMIKALSGMLPVLSFSRQRAIPT